MGGRRGTEIQAGDPVKTALGVGKVAVGMMLVWVESGLRGRSFWMDSHSSLIS